MPSDPPAFDPTEWQQRYVEERRRYACWLWVEVPDQLRAGAAISVTVYPDIDHRDAEGAFADERYRQVGYEPPFKLFDEILDDSMAAQLSGALSVVRTVHGLTSHEALGFLVNLFTVIVDFYWARQGRESILFGPAMPRSSLVHELGQSGALPAWTAQPQFAVSSLIETWQHHAAIGVEGIFVPPVPTPGRFNYLVIPPSWLSLDEVLKLGGSESDVRKVPLTVDIELAPLLAKQAEYFDEHRRLGGTVVLSFDAVHEVERPVARSDGPVVSQKGKTWDLSFAGERVAVRNSKGMHHIALLLSRPHREIHATELVQMAGQGDMAHPLTDAGSRGPGTGSDQLRTGRLTGTGPALDEQAKREYRAKLEQLDEDYAAAEEAGDLARAAEIDDQRGWLLRELRAAAGLGGRDRATNSPVERARQNVKKAIDRTLRDIAEVHPPLAAYLKQTIRTGGFCVYTPIEIAP
jgi:hypothetical protein